MARGSPEQDQERARLIRTWLEELSAAQHEGDGARKGKPGDQSVWEYMRRPPKGPRPALTHDQIAATAVELADADGLDAVTMRALAKRLDVATMGLYRYIRGKDDLFALMLDTVHGEISVPDKEEDDWRAAVRHLAREMRALYLRHPWLSQLEARSFFILAPKSLAIAEAGLGILDATGADLDVDQMMAAFGTVGAYVRGSTATEIARRAAYRRFGWATDEDMRQAAGPQVLQMLAEGDYPNLAHYIIDGSNEDDAEWTFAFGLECVLDGIAARLDI
jgi:AcrR family transcriptional regulator